MFERYTEPARRAIFFARYEASQFGSLNIEVEHLLLGIFRESGDKLEDVLPTAKRDQIRQQIESQPPKGEKISTSAELPLSQEARRVLAYAAQEMETLKHENLDIGHLLLGILHEKKCLPAKLLQQSGLTLDIVRQRVVQHEKERSAPFAARTPAPEPAHDLVALAAAGTLPPVAGREREIEMALRILSRRSRNSVALIGEPGAGKTAIVHAIAQRFASGEVPRSLADRTIIDGGTIRPGAILLIDGRFDIRMKEGVQYIVTATPRRFREADECITSRYAVVYVAPPSEEEAARILAAVKPQYESFHGVVIEESALETALLAARRFLPYRVLPERAIDLIDDACARVKLRVVADPPEIRELHARIRQITRKMENAIATHKFEEARHLSREERQERQNLRNLQEQHHGRPVSQNTVSREDIEQAVADRAAIPLSAVQRVLAEKDPAPLEELAKAFASELPTEHRDWAAALAAHILACSPDDAQSLAHTILSVTRTRPA